MSRIALRGMFTLRQFRGGLLIAEHAFPNAVVNEGANLLLETMFRSAAARTWYIGLIASAPTLNNADTMGSHPGWAELTAYSQGARAPWVLSNPASNRRLVNVTAEGAVYSFPVAATIGGAFLTDSSAKGGNTGALFCTATVGVTLLAGDGVTMSYQLQVA